MLDLSFKISGSYFCSNRVSVKFTKHLHISLFAIYKSSQLWVYSLWTPLGAPTQSSIQPFLVHFWIRHFAHLSVTIDRRPSHSLSLRLSVCPSIRPSVTLCVLLYLRPSSVHCPSLRPSARPSVRPTIFCPFILPSIFRQFVRPAVCLFVFIYIRSDTRLLLRCVKGSRSQVMQLYLVRRPLFRNTATCCVELTVDHLSVAEPAGQNLHENASNPSFHLAFVELVLAFPSVVMKRRFTGHLLSPATLSCHSILPDEL